LRTAKVISIKLGLDDIAEWIDAELNGYSGKGKIPPYRYFSGRQLQVLNPYQGWRPAGQLRTKFPVYQPVSELEALLDSESIVVPLTRDLH
jgi:hypothetical protein